MINTGGYYVPAIKDLTNEFEHNTNILRYLISRINEDDILEEKEEKKDSI